MDEYAIGGTMDESFVRIDDLIAKLTELRETHGNLPVYTAVNDGCDEMTLDLSFVEFRETSPARSIYDGLLPDRIMIE
jgi:hypothetical protein